MPDVLPQSVLLAIPTLTVAVNVLYGEPTGITEVTWSLKKEPYLPDLLPNPVNQEEIKIKASFWTWLNCEEFTREYHRIKGIFRVTPIPMLPSKEPPFLIVSSFHLYSKEKGSYKGSCFCGGVRLRQDGSNQVISGASHEDRLIREVVDTAA